MPACPVKDGAPVTEAVEAGEVIWRDDIGATCRRWNWRQCVRTRIGPDTTDVWFVLEALGPMPEAALVAAGEALAGELRRLSPAAEITIEPAT